MSWLEWAREAVFPFHRDFVNSTSSDDPLVSTPLGPLPLPPKSVVPNYVQHAIPWFLVLIAVEFVVAYLTGLRKRGKGASSAVKYSWQTLRGSTTDRPFFRTNDSINSLSHGSVSQYVGAFTRSLSIVPYTWLWVHCRAFDVPDTWPAWVAIFIILDFFYYWFHRQSHEWNFSWAAHSVHHSSENYNLTSALRQAAFQQWLSWIYYLPMAFIGFSPRLYMAHLQFNVIYQFWIHTELVPKLGWLEYIINTPSQHRVHHGRNPYCIDKNYGGTLAVWDRLFGTFAEERDDEVIKYGLVHAPPDWDPIWANFEHFSTMRKRVAKVAGMLGRLPVIWKGPGWKPVGPPYQVPGVESQPTIRYDPPLPLWLKVYAVVHFGVHIESSIFYWSHHLGFSMSTRLIFTAINLWALHSIGRTLSRHASATWTEALRLLTVCASVALAHFFATPASLRQALLSFLGGSFLSTEDGLGAALLPALETVAQGMREWGARYPNEGTVRIAVGYLVAASLLLPLLSTAWRKSMAVTPGVGKKPVTTSSPLTKKEA